MQVRRLSLLAITTLCLSPLMHAHAQGSFWDSKNAYLGQTPPTDTPKIFAPGALAEPGMFAMGRTAFSPDGKEFYYAQNDSWNSGKHLSLRMIRYQKGGWSKPIVLFPGFISPTFSGQTLYMRKTEMNAVWQTHRAGQGWNTPALFLQDPNGVYDFMPTRSGRAYVGSTANAEDKKNGITYAFSVLTTTHGKAAIESLGRPLNEPGFNGDLYVAPDESYMIVSAKETASYQSQLFISFRKADATWTVPVSLGPKINDGLAHRWGQYVTPDGKYLFYSHGTSEKDCAIYWVRFDTLLKSLQPKHS
jgi:hypothetical protein